MISTTTENNSHRKWNGGPSITCWTMLVVGAKGSNSVKTAVISAVWAIAIACDSLSVTRCARISIQPSRVPHMSMTRRASWFNQVGCVAPLSTMALVSISCNVSEPDIALSLASPVSVVAIGCAAPFSVVSLLAIARCASVRRLDLLSYCNNVETEMSVTDALGQRGVSMYWWPCRVYIQS